MATYEGEYEEENEDQEPAMTEDELVSICMGEVNSGIGGSYNDENTEIALALDYYFGRRPGLTSSQAKDPNASRYVSMDVMDSVEATVAEIMPTFTADMVAFYVPDDERDEDMARQETELMNYLFMEEYDGHTLLQIAIKDALLHKNCTVKAYWDERAQVTYETHENVPEMALAQLLQPNQENQHVEVVEQIVTEEGQPEQAQMIEMAQAMDPEAAAYAMQDPSAQQDVQQAMMIAQNKYSIKIKRITRIGRPVIENVPPENIIVSSGHNSPYLDDCAFVAHEDLVIESDLIAQGFDPDIVMELPTYHGGMVESSRRRHEDYDDYESGHHSTRKIQVFECYPLIDFDGDGIAERRKVVISGNNLLSNEEWKTVPLIGGCATVMPHKYQGISLFERMKNIQDSKTPVIRSIIDGTRLSGNPRVGVVTGEVNLDDLLTSRTGGVVRADSINSVFPLPNPEVPQSSYGMLSYMDEQRSERGGSAVDTASQAQKVSGDTAHGIERAMSAMELHNALIARTIGETLVRGIFIQLHDLLRENFPGVLKARVGGKWVSSYPKNWKQRTNVSVQVGSSHAERARQAAILKEAIALQMQLAQVGSTLVSEEKGYRAIASAMNLSGIKEPENYWVDPESPEGKQSKQQKQQKQMQKMQQEMAMQQEMMAAQKQMAQAEMMKGQADIMAQRVKLENERLKLQLDQANNRAEQYESGVKAAMDQDKIDKEFAIKLLEIEQKAQADLNREYQQNVRAVS